MIRTLRPSSWCTVPIVPRARSRQGKPIRDAFWGMTNPPGIPPEKALATPEARPIEHKVHYQTQLRELFEFCPGAGRSPGAWRGGSVRYRFDEHQLIAIDHDEIPLLDRAPGIVRWHQAKCVAVAGFQVGWSREWSTEQSNDDAGTLQSVSNRSARPNHFVDLEVLGSIHRPATLALSACLPEKVLPFEVDRLWLGSQVKLRSGAEPSTPGLRIAGADFGFGPVCWSLTRLFQEARSSEQESPGRASRPRRSRSRVGPSSISWNSPLRSGERERPIKRRQGFSEGPLLQGRIRSHTDAGAGGVVETPPSRRTLSCLHGTIISQAWADRGGKVAFFRASIGSEMVSSLPAGVILFMEAHLPSNP